MEKEERDVLAAFQRMQQAMIEKDVETMKSLVTKDKVFTHLSGRVQTGEEFFEDIANGTLNYYQYKIDDPDIRIEGDQALFQADTTLKAKVYGMSGEWTLHTIVHYIKRNGQWIQQNGG